MAICEICRREMLSACGCIKIPVLHHGKNFHPIKVGDPADFFFGEYEGRCGDCGAKPGHYHHPGCDCERCPVCGGQLISCGCDDRANLYFVQLRADQDDKRTTREKVASNIKTIFFIDSQQKDKKDLWFRFIRVPVGARWAIYQITHVTKTTVVLSFCPLLPVGDADYDEFSVVAPQWGNSARVSRKKVENLLAHQAAEPLSWEQIGAKMMEGF